MSKSKIDWPFKDLYSYNPVIGCLNECKNCYAARFINRFREEKDFKVFTTNFKDPEPKNKECTFFLNEFSEPFFWELQWLTKVMKIVQERSHQTFIILSHTIAFYESGFVFPKNLILGLTDTGAKEIDVSAWLAYQGSNKLFLSYEPMEGPIRYNIPKEATVVAGMLTGPGSKKHNMQNLHNYKKWILQLRNNYDGKIYLKGDFKLLIR